MVAYAFDDIYFEHQAMQPHPERPQRLGAVRDALEAAGLSRRGERLPTRLAEDDEMGRVHTAGYLSLLQNKVAGRAGWLDPDTYFAPRSYEAARAGAAAAVDLALASLHDRARKGFALVRPPGHHAEPDRPMGFCLVNNIAVAAAAARAGGAARVAIVDWDVHHGNGTQAAFYDDPTVLYLSSHQYPYFPGTGKNDETGTGAGKGTTVNVPLPAGSGDAEYESVFDEVFLPALRAFRPDLILVSAGFDAYDGDPLAMMRVSPEGYRRMAAGVRQVADEVASGRMVCILEGGYDLEGLGTSARLTYEVMAAPEAPAPAALRGGDILPAARASIDATRRLLTGHLGFPEEDR